MLKSLLLPIHISFAGIWLGCVLTETLFERALLGQGAKQEAILVALHKRVDLLIEIPAFMMVLITGLLMFAWETATSLVLIKIAIAAAAITANVYCVVLVFQRAKAFEMNDRESFEYLDHLQHLFGAVVLLGIVIALAMGFYLSM